MAVIRGPVHGRVSASLGGIGHRLEVVFDVFIVAVSTVGFLLLFVFQVRLVLYQNANDVLIAVTRCPQQRIPPVFFILDVRAIFDCIDDRIEVVSLHSLHQ